VFFKNHEIIPLLITPCFLLTPFWDLNEQNTSYLQFFILEMKNCKNIAGFGTPFDKFLGNQSTRLIL
jgi:hypothetical protein